MKHYGTIKSMLSNRNGNIVFLAYHCSRQQMLQVMVSISINHQFCQVIGDLLQ